MHFVFLILQVFKASAEPLAALIVATVAIIALRTWRREFLGKRRIELAEEVLELFYKAKDAITQMRHPLSLSTERLNREVTETETNAQKEATDAAYVPFFRYKQNQDVFNKLHAIRYRFMAQVGKDKVNPFDSLHRIVNEILIAATRLAELWARQRRSSGTSTDETLESQIEKYEAVFRYQGKDDELSKRVEDAVMEIEKTCRAVIEKGYSNK